MRNRRLSLALLLLASAGSHAEPPHAHAELPHVIEELTFQVAPADQGDFLRHDREIWTEILSQHHGYLGKETWLANRPEDEIKLVVRWQTQKDWDSVSKELLTATNERFKAAMSEDRYKLLRVRAFRNVKESSDAAIEIDDLLSRENLLQTSVVEIRRDPVYKRTKRYLAVPISHQIMALHQQRSLTGEEGPFDITVDCTDDYKVRISFKVFLRLTRESLPTPNIALAYRDLEAIPNGNQWITPASGEPGPKPAKMGSSYLVWPNLENPSVTKWPYAIERIRLVKRPD